MLVAGAVVAEVHFCGGLEQEAEDPGPGCGDWIPRMESVVDLVGAAQNGNQKIDKMFLI